MNNEIKINVPEGMEIDKENSTFECIKFKPKKKELPKTWEEFYKNNPITQEEHFIRQDSVIRPISYCYRDSIVDANLLPSREYAEAMLALCKLIQLRDCYNGGWKPNWLNGDENKYTIIYYAGEILKGKKYLESALLNFKTENLRDTFYINFKDLIEQAKLLL